MSRASFRATSWAGSGWEDGSTRPAVDARSRNGLEGGGAARRRRGERGGHRPKALREGPQGRLGRGPAGGALAWLRSGPPTGVNAPRARASRATLIADCAAAGLPQALGQAEGPATRMHEWARDRESSHANQSSTRWRRDLGPGAESRVSEGGRKAFGDGTSADHSRPPEVSLVLAGKAPLASGLGGHDLLSGPADRPVSPGAARAESSPRAPAPFHGRGRAACSIAEKSRPKRSAAGCARALVLPWRGQAKAAIRRPRVPGAASGLPRRRRMAGLPERGHGSSSPAASSGGGYIRGPNRSVMPGRAKRPSRQSLWN